MSPGRLELSQPAGRFLCVFTAQTGCPEPGMEAALLRQPAAAAVPSYIRVSPLNAR